MKNTIILLMFSVGITACNGGKPAIPECTPGESSACVCTGNRFGAQVCDPDGTYGACDCGCDVGYESDADSCVDIDECSRALDSCDPNADCTNTDGGFDCACSAGFEGNGWRCVDIDECLTGSDACDANATCHNIYGAYTCTCNNGFTGDGASCDVDECALGTDNCHPQATCTNTAGSFICACNSGFTGDGMSCVNVDECQSDLDNCDVNADCQDTIGSFACVCNAGYQGDGTACANVDECAMGLDDCGANSFCTDEVPGFSCACASGYLWDGSGCVAKADFVADLRMSSVEFEISMIGLFDVRGLSRIGADFEVFETPSGQGTHKSPGNLSYPDITLRNIEGPTIDINGLLPWFEAGTGYANAKDLIVRLTGLDGERAELSLISVVPVAIDATVTDLGLSRSSMAEIVLRIRRDAPHGIELSLYTAASNFPPCAAPGERLEISGIMLAPLGYEQCYGAGTLAIPTPGPTDGFFIPDSRLGENANEWFIIFASAWFDSGIINRRSMSAIEEDATSTETNRVNMFEMWPAGIDYFDPTKTYGAHYLFNLHTVHDYSDQS